MEMYMVIIDCLISELIIKLTATPEKTEALVCRLALTEFGIAAYCRKWAGELDNTLIPLDPNHTHHSNNPLAWFLFQQYIEERLHGQMLGALIGDAEMAHRRWSSAFVGEERVEGLSNISPFWWLLGGKRAKDLSIGDRLAMMSVLEGWAKRFYECLFHSLPDCPLRRLADKIGIDEIKHQETLYALLINEVGATKASWLIMKWRIKALLVLPEVLRLGLAFANNNSMEVKHDAVC